MVVLEAQVTCIRATRRCVGLALTMLAVIAGPAAAQTVSAPGLKAAYLFNFARFVQWPADAIPAGAPLVLCIVNDRAVAAALQETTRGRSVQGHALTVQRIEAIGPLPACHILFISASEKRRTDIIETVQGKLMLTVSDADRFARTGGMVELFLEDGLMKIAVNVDALLRGNIRLSSRVLAMAVIVKDASPR
jgi:hypothetical protein